MKKRECQNCCEYLPPETEHFELHGVVYCKECVEVVPYTAYQYFLDGEYMGDSEHDGDDVRFVESYDDEYEEENPINE